jgi:chromosome segregation ATPase
MVFYMILIFVREAEETLDAAVDARVAELREELNGAHFAEVSGLDERISELEEQVRRAEEEADRERRRGGAVREALERGGGRLEVRCFFFHFLCYFFAFFFFFS